MTDRLRELASAQVTKWRTEARDADVHTQCDLEGCADELDALLRTEGAEPVAALPSTDFFADVIRELGIQGTQWTRESLLNLLKAFKQDSETMDEIEERKAALPSTAPGVDLDAIKKREAAATKGPWFQGPYYRADVESKFGCIRANCWNAPQAIADADFIAHARQDIPALIAEVERLRAEGAARTTEGAKMMSAFNEYQQAYIRELAEMSPDQKCACGWYRRGDCPNCAPDRGGYERCGDRATAFLTCSQKKGHAGMHAGWPTNQVSGSVALWSTSTEAAGAPAQEPEHSDLVQRLRARAMIEAPEDDEDALNRVAFEDVPEITFAELAEIGDLLREAADALEASSTGRSSQPSPWQPIETAPKDGAVVLLWWLAEIGRGCVAFWACGRWRVFGDGSCGWVGESFHASENGHWTRLIGERPTHWMPLPSPPGSAPAAVRAPLEGQETKE